MLRTLGVEAEMARGAWHRALDALLHRLWRESPEAVLRPLPQGRGHGGEEAAEGDAAGATSRREVRRAPREGVAAGAHEVDQALPESGRPKPGPGARRAPRRRDLRRSRRGRNLP